MKLRNTWFLCAIARSSASAAASVAGGGSFMPRLRAIERGTMPSTSARRDASPITDSMWRSSSGVMPMWRGMNSWVFSSSPSGWADDIGMGLRVVLHDLAVRGLVHQRVELRHVPDPDLEEPAVAHRLLVRHRRIGAQVLVDLGHLAGERHEDVGGGLHRLHDPGHFAR